MRQTHEIHNIPRYFFEVHFNIIDPFTSRSSEWSLPWR